MWKVETENHGSVNIDANQLVTSLLSTAMKKQQSNAATELDTAVVCKTYIRSFLAPMFDMTSIGSLVEISFILGRQYERFLNTNDVNFSFEEKDTSDS